MEHEAIALLVSSACCLFFWLHHRSRMREEARRYAKLERDREKVAYALRAMLDAVQPIRMTFEGQGGTISPYLVEDLDAAIKLAKESIWTPQHYVQVGQKWEKQT